MVPETAAGKKEICMMQNSMKKLIAVVLVLALGMPAFTMQSEAYEDYQNSVSEPLQETENPFTYKFLEDGTVEITGYNGDESEIVIPDDIEGHSVKEFSDYASFYTCTNLKIVRIKILKKQFLNFQCNTNYQN